MATKKLSGVQRARLEPIRHAMKASSVFSRPVRKRGRPKGETERHQELQKQIHMDLAWLGCPYKPDLYSFLVKNLLDLDWRKEYELTPPECPKVYKRIGERHFRREIAFVHQEIWGKKSKKESRSLWQHWRHQNYRLTRVQKDTIVIGTGNCRRCVRGGVYVGPCYCLLGGVNPEAREIRQQGVKIAMTKRKCMCCGDAFLSEGIHNRLCLKCRRPQRGLDDLI
jgi:hypothetical protein